MRKIFLFQPLQFTFFLFPLCRSTEIAFGAGSSSCIVAAAPTQHTDSRQSYLLQEEFCRVTAQNWIRFSGTKQYTRYVPVPHVTESLRGRRRRRRCTCCIENECMYYQQAQPSYNNKSILHLSIAIYLHNGIPIAIYCQVGFFPSPCRTSAIYYFSVSGLIEDEISIKLF